MSISVFSCTAKYSWRILLIRLYCLSLFSKRAKIVSAYSEKTSNKKLLQNWRNLLVRLKDFCRILEKRLNNFGIFSHKKKLLLAYFLNTQKELRIRWNIFALSTMPDNFQGTVFGKIQVGIIYCLEKNNLQFNVPEIFLKKIALCVCGETAKRQKSIKIEHISVLTWEYF